MTIIQTQNGRRPTSQQAELIKMASAKNGTTREEVREYLGYKEGVSFAVNGMFRNIAERFGLNLTVTTEQNEAGRNISVFHLSGKKPGKATQPAKAAPAKAKPATARRAIAKATKAGKAKAAKAKPTPAAIKAKNTEAFKAIRRKA